MTGEVLLALRMLLGASLFAFLGFVIWLQWRDLRLQAGLLASRKIPPVSLLSQYDGESPQLHNYQVAEITIGRDPACECVVADEAISSHHARLSFHHNQWWLEDLDSKNGTRLNENVLTIPTVVISGDKISCGRSTLTVIINPE